MPDFVTLASHAGVPGTGTTAVMPSSPLRGKQVAIANALPASPHVS
jgi:hypothetical protein